VSLARAFLEGLRRIEVAVAVVAFAVVAAALFADVAGRNAFGHGIFWASRLASYCTTVAGMLGFALVVSTGQHFRIRSIDRIFPEAADQAMNRLADFISMMICFWLVYYALDYVHASYAVGMRGMGIDIPTWPIQSIIPYVFASAGIRYLLYGLFPPLRPVPE